MSLKILFFFPHNPYPPKSGAHKRCLEMLTGLREIGCKVSLASSTLSSHTDWNISSIRSLEEALVEKVFIHEANFLDWKFIGFLRKFHRLTKTKPSLATALHTPPRMRWWFSKIIAKTSPDLIIMNYALWDGLLQHNSLHSIPRVIETHDLLTLNSQMQEALNPHLTNLLIKTDEFKEEILNENFFNNLELGPSAEEFYIYDQYDCTLAISSEEANIIQKNTEKTKTLLIPVTQKPCNILNNYTGSAVFPIGPNPFNIQGYLYLTKKVLPKILQTEPLFSVDVTGSLWNNISLEPCQGIQLKGFVPDLEAVYKQSRFLICPVFGGTGQQVKVVEAMAHGLPVVALRQAAKRSPIKHGVNGFIADNAEEFAKYSILLWQQKDLCQQLGNAARETIATEFSRERLFEGLSLMLQSSFVSHTSAA